MAPNTPIRQPSAAQQTKLRAEAHRKTIQYIELAERSDRAEIRAVALELARDEAKYFHSQEARVGPHTALFFCTFVCVATVAAMWYTTTNYKTAALVWEIDTPVVAMALIAILVCLTLSGHVPASSLVNFIHSVWDKFKTKPSKQYNSKTSEGEQS